MSRPPENDRYYGDECERPFSRDEHRCVGKSHGDAYVDQADSAAMQLALDRSDSGRELVDSICHARRCVRERGHCRVDTNGKRNFSIQRARVLNARGSRRERGQRSRQAHSTFSALGTREVQSYRTQPFLERVRQRCRVRLATCRYPAVQVERFADSNQDATSRPFLFLEDKPDRQ